jgi:hypothetical protein
MQTFRPLPFGLALGLSMAALSMLCWIAVLIAPAASLAHSWLGLFTTAPVSSAQALIVSVGVSFGAGAFTGIVTAALYNLLVERGT